MSEVHANEHAHNSWHLVFKSFRNWSFHLEYQNPKFSCLYKCKNDLFLNLLNLQEIASNWKLKAYNSKTFLMLCCPRNLAVLAWSIPPPPPQKKIPADFPTCFANSIFHWWHQNSLFWLLELLKLVVFKSKGFPRNFINNCFEMFLHNIELKKEK